MPNKSLKTPVMILAVGMVLCLVACLLTGILKTPTVTQQDFHYCATYRVNGEVKTLEGIYRCQFSHHGSSADPLERYYSGEYLPVSEEEDPHILGRQGDLQLEIIYSFSDSYLMGDGFFTDEYEESIPAPYLAVFDGEGYEYSDPESLAKFDAELISWENPQPIENSFVFAGFSVLHSGSMFSMLLVGILMIVACLIFVKRDKSVPYKTLDKVSIAVNFIIGIFVLPLLTLAITFMPLYVSGDELYYQIDLCIPAIITFAIAASIALRRKGYTKAGFFIQFAGPVLFALTGIWESII